MAPGAETRGSGGQRANRSASVQSLAPGFFVDKSWRPINILHCTLAYTVKGPLMVNAPAVRALNEAQRTVRIRIGNAHPQQAPSSDMRTESAVITATRERACILKNMRDNSTARTAALPPEIIDASPTSG